MKNNIDYSSFDTVMMSGIKTPYTESYEVWCENTQIDDMNDLIKAYEAFAIRKSTAASDAAAPLFKTARKSATSVANAARLVRGSASRWTPAQVDLSNIHAGISSLRSDSDAFRSQRKTTPPGRSIAA